MTTKKPSKTRLETTAFPDLHSPGIFDRPYKIPVAVDAMRIGGRSDRILPDAHILSGDKQRRSRMQHLMAYDPALMEEAREVAREPKHATIAALIPAAGRSTRMGRPKLILPVAGISLITRVISALQKGGTGRVVVVTAPADSPGASALIKAAEAQGAEVVVAPSQTIDMRATIELGLEYLAKSVPPSNILIAPGDSPLLSPSHVARIIQKATNAPGHIIVPCYEGQRGHPLLLPWALASEIRRLPDGVGVNELLTSRAKDVVTFEIDDPGVLTDLDTPEDYRRVSENGACFHDP